MTASRVKQALRSSFAALGNDASVTYFTIFHAVSKTHQLLALARLCQHLPEIALTCFQHVWGASDYRTAVLVSEAIPNFSSARTEVVQSASAQRFGVWILRECQCFAMALLGNAQRHKSVRVATCEKQCQKKDTEHHRC
jgi:hypothetical protein